MADSPDGGVAGLGKNSYAQQLIADGIRSAVWDRIDHIISFHWLLIVACICSTKIVWQNGLGNHPAVFGQNTPRNDTICSLLSSMLLRKVRHSLLFRWHFNLVARLSQSRRRPHGVQIFTECMRIGPDDASRISVEWVSSSLGDTMSSQSHSKSLRRKEQNNVAVSKEEILLGPIVCPVVLILDMPLPALCFRTYTNRGWVVAAVKLDSLGRKKFCTKHLRFLTNVIGNRMSRGEPLFLVGHSIGGKFVLEYLGEEGLAESLHPAVAGGVSLGSPAQIFAPSFKSFLLRGLELVTGHLSVERYNFADDEDKVAVHEPGDVLSPDVIKRLHPIPLHLANASNLASSGRRCIKSSSNHIKQVPVPVLILTAEDDMATPQNLNAASWYRHHHENPNVIFVKIKSWGYLWRDFLRGSTPFRGGDHLGDYLDDASWSTICSAKFLDAVVKIRASHRAEKENAIFHTIVPKTSDVKGQMYLVGYPEHSKL